MKRKSILFPVIFALVIPMLAVLQGCPRFDPEDPDDAKRYLRTQCMDVFYYWRDDVIDRMRRSTLPPTISTIISTPSSTSRTAGAGCATKITMYPKKPAC